MSILITAMLVLTSYTCMAHLLHCCLEAMAQIKTAFVRRCQPLDHQDAWSIKLISVDLIMAFISRNIMGRSASF